MSNVPPDDIDDLYPLSNPEWQAMARECRLVVQLLGAGATALGKASYADGEGNYYVAFFSLSAGIERLAKLIFIADFALKNSGVLPKENEIRKFGHRIVDLLEKVDEISKAHNLYRSHKRPMSKISRAIIGCLDSFADAQRGRYANFQAIGDPNFQKEFEPISKWWQEVVKLILEKHYHGTRTEQTVERNAAIISDAADHLSIVIHRNETGNIMQDVLTASIRTGQTKVAQRYGRYYVLRIVRWMAEIFCELTSTKGYEPGFGSLFGHYELFNTFLGPC